MFFFNEQLYFDIAQVGAKCQTLNVTSSGDDHSISMDFSVKYGPLPFTITELYTPSDEIGMYVKRAAMPGGRLLELPPVIVDIRMDQKEGVTAFTVYSCLDFGPGVRELVIATKDLNPPQELLDDIVDTALRARVDIASDDLKKVVC